MGEDKPKQMVLPVLALRGMVMFPGIVTRISVGRPPSLLALRASIDADKRLVLVSQRDAAVDVPAPEDLYDVGVTVAVQGTRDRQDGRAVFRFAVVRMAEVSAELLERNGLSGDDLTLFVPHQANQEPCLRRRRPRHLSARHARVHRRFRGRCKPRPSPRAWQLPGSPSRQNSIFQTSGAPCVITCR